MSSTRTFKIAIATAVGLLLAAAPVSAKTKTTTSKSHTASSSHKSSHSKATVKRTSSKTPKSSKKSKSSWKTRGQQNIDTNRAREIQAALIRAHYLDGEPTGAWDVRSKTAMERFQADNGWQTKKIPDARALIKLGLGPDHSDLINPDTASIGTPDTIKGGGVPNNPR